MKAIVTNLVDASRRPIQASDARIWLFPKRRVACLLPSFGIHLPYTDFTALGIPGVAVVREYQACGVIDDVQIGQPSDNLSATFGRIEIALL